MGRMIRTLSGAATLGLLLILLASCGAAEFRDALERMVEYASWEDQQILFVRGNGDKPEDMTINEIYIMDVNGNNQKKLTQNSVEDKDPTWSPDRNLILYATDNGGDFDLAVMTPEGSFGGYLTENNPDLHDYQPSWSHNTNQVVYTRYEFPRNQVFVKDANLGATEHRRTDQTANDAFGDWSPNDDEIVYMSERDGDWEIVVMDSSNGTIDRQLTDNNADDCNPSWSPDGTKIAYHSTEDGDTEIFTINADGSGGKLQLTNNVFHGDASPDWSPDGKKIVFQSNRDGNWEIYMMNPDGTEQTRLTYNDADDIWPCW